jgi:hypothetical protein
MPPRLRTLFDQIGVIVALAGLFAGAWIAVTGTYRPPLWVNPLAAAAVMGVATLLEHAFTARAQSRRTVPRHGRAAAR